MNNEFKKLTSKQETRYILETTSGATSSAVVATAEKPLGELQRRETMSVPVNQKPRQGPLKPQTGGGKHRDKKKEQKSGKEKHRKPFAEGHDNPDHEISMASSELQSIAADAKKLLMLVKRYSEMEGLEAWQQSKITKAADYMNSVLQSIRGDEEQGVAEGGILKSIKRGLQGWDKNAIGPGGEKLGDPRDIVKRAKAMDTDTARKVRSGLDAASDHSPAGLQKRVLDRKLKGVAEGADVEYVVVIRDEQGKRSIRISALTPTDAKEKAEAQGYKVLKVKDPREANYFREQGVAEAKSPEEFIKQLKSLDNKQPRVTHTCEKCGKKWQLQHHCKGAPDKKEQGVAEGVAGPKSCWPGHRKVGTQPGTGKNKGKRVNDCEKIKKEDMSHKNASENQSDSYMESLSQFLESALNEKAVSKAQQRFMGMVHAAQKGKKAASPEVAKVAKDMGKKDAKDFAATKHKGLPEKKKSKK